jgi:hypothetical protein
MSDENFSGSLGVIGHLRIGEGPNALRLENGPGGVLMVGSGTTPSAASIAAPIFGPPMHSGTWYPPFGHTGLTTGAIATNARMYLIPYLIGKACTINGVCVDITSAGEAGSVVRLGLFADADGLAGALVADWGTVAGDAIAIPTLTPSTPVQAAWYWVGVAAQLAPTTRPTCRVYQSAVVNRVGLTNPGTGGSCGAYYNDPVTGAFPAAASPAVGVVSVVTPPVVWLKAA